MQQQMWFLFQSICLGLVQGVLLDMATGLGKSCKMVYRVYLDIAYGPIAALLLFFGSLVIMDGQLHPLLLLGSALGVMVEHVTVGVPISKCVAYICGMLQTTVRFSRKTSVRLFTHVRKIALAFYGGGGEERKRAKNAEKTAKQADIFQKNT